jgi:hypothetical protein
MSAIGAWPSWKWMKPADPCRRPHHNDAFAQQAWYESWKKLAERVEALASPEGGQYLMPGETPGFDTYPLTAC